MPNPWNPNVQTGEMFKKGVQSMKELGMLGSILVRETGTDAAGEMWYQILDGEHRWKYGQENGYTELPVENMGTITDQEAQFLTIHLNNLRGKDDVEKRAKIFEMLSEGQLQLLPFSKEDIENEKALFKFDFASYAKPELPDKPRMKTFMVSCSEDEHKVIMKALALAKAEYKQEPLAWLLEQVKDYLQLRLGASALDTTVSFEDTTGSLL